MAARIDRLHSERVRARIKLSQLVTRIESNGLGELEMTPSQLDAAKFLVNKAMANPPTILEGPGDKGQHKLEVILGFK